jgi:hypothetical protein
MYFVPDLVGILYEKENFIQTLRRVTQLIVLEP